MSLMQRRRRLFCNAAAVGGLPPPSVWFDLTGGVLPGDLTLTRPTQAFVTNSGGSLAAISNGAAAFDYGFAGGQALRIEQACTNVLLNSTIDGVSLATQSVTVTAVPWTLSFYGTGQVVLSGAASATVVGLGAYPNRKTLTFTPTAGTLTLTVTGTVSYAQLEAQSFASSWIATAGAPVTRNADVFAIGGATAAALNASSGTLVVELDGLVQKTADNATVVGGSSGSVLRAYVGTTAGPGSATYNSYSGSSALSSTNRPDYRAVSRILVDWFPGGRSIAANGIAAVSDANAIGSAASWFLGSYAGASGFLQGGIRKFKIYPGTVSAAQKQMLSTVGGAF